MRTVITNSKGNAAIKAMVKTQAENLIFLYSEEGEEMGLDKAFSVRYELVEVDNVLDSIKKIRNVFKEIQNDVSVAIEPDELGLLLFLVANALEIRKIYMAFNDRLIGFSATGLKPSGTKARILSMLTEKPLKAVELAKILGISRGMVYKHLNELIENNHIQYTPKNKKYALTEAGEIASVLFVE